MILVSGTDARDIAAFRLLTKVIGCKKSQETPREIKKLLSIIGGLAGKFFEFGNIICLPEKILFQKQRTKLLIEFIDLHIRKNFKLIISYGLAAELLQRAFGRYILCTWRTVVDFVKLCKNFPVQNLNYLLIAPAVFGLIICGALNGPI